MKKSEEKKKISRDDTASIAAEDYARNLFANRTISAHVDTNIYRGAVPIKHPSQETILPSVSALFMKTTGVFLTGKTKRRNKINPCSDQDSIASSIFFEKSEESMAALDFSDTEETDGSNASSPLVAGSGDELNLSATSFSAFGKYEKKAEAELKEEDIFAAQQFMYTLAKIRLSKADPTPR